MRILSKAIIIILLSTSLTACSVDGIRAYFHKSDVAITEIIISESEEINVEEDEIKLPDEFNLGIIFFPQAPYGDWSLPYQESCEEASLLLASYYLTDQDVNIETFHQDLLDMVEWEKGHFGQYLHTSVEETAEIAELYLGLSNYEIVDNPTVDQMKKFVSQGYPIVAPFSGRDLKNPFFKGTKPFYHMLVIRGYEDGQFITNDVGTRRGENYLYPFDVINSAMHDLHPDVFDDPAAVVKGPKRILVLKPNVTSSAAGLETELVE